MRTRPRLWNRSDPDRPKRCSSIMRPSLLSNPYIVGFFGTREQCITEFERYARQSPRILAFIERLDDADLMCCCAPMPCHGDVILRLWDELNPLEG
jgi:hypothetical protein